MAAGGARVTSESGGGINYPEMGFSAPLVDASLGIVRARTRTATLNIPQASARGWRIDHGTRRGDLGPHRRLGISRIQLVAPA